MWTQHFLLLSFCIYLCIGNESSIKVTKCKWNDSKCIKDSAQELIPAFAGGIPEYGVESIDPIRFKKIDASSSNLKLILTDTVLTGLKGCKAKKIERDIENSKLLVKVLCSAELNGDYDIDGKLFILPITGKGKLHVKIPKIQINTDADIREIKGKDGKTYWDIESWKHTFELKDKSEVKFENLFGGNDELSRTARKVIADGGNDIVLEVAPPIIRTATERIIGNVNNYFHAVPIEELTLN